MNRLKKDAKIIFLIVTFIIASILPFIDYLVIIEIFYLSVPLALAFTITSVFLVINLIDKREDKSKVFAWCFVPVFVLAQFLSTYAVDMVQGFRAEYLINEIERGLQETDEFPSTVKSSWGIEIKKSNNPNAFTVTYSRGFLVREVYDSKTKSWKSYGWND